MGIPINNVPLIPIPEGATEEERLELFEEWKRQFAQANPGHFNSDGSRITIWQQIKNLWK